MEINIISVFFTVLGSSLAVLEARSPEKAQELENWIDSREKYLEDLARHITQGRAFEWLVTLATFFGLILIGLLITGSSPVIDVTIPWYLYAVTIVFMVPVIFALGTYLLADYIQYLNRTHNNRALTGIGMTLVGVDIILSIISFLP